MARVVCVHGVGKQALGAQSLLRDWWPALADGLTRDKTFCINRDGLQKATHAPGITLLPQQRHVPDKHLLQITARMAAASAGSSSRIMVSACRSAVVVLHRMSVSRRARYVYRAPRRLREYLCAEPYRFGNHPAVFPDTPGLRVIPSR
ncbi:MAG: hypothetical protein ACRDTF_21895 [Pseudonocardiaceae bacterium]